MKRTTILLLLFIALAVPALTVCAQDTVVFTVQLQEVPIMEPAQAKLIAEGARVDQPDSTIRRIYPAGNLSDLLGQSGMLSLKSYGPGALATTSVRGANSMQTPIIWNGINLQNITNNTVDLSLMPSFLFDLVGIQPGSSSAAWGSGTIGGVISVSSRPLTFSPQSDLLSAGFTKQKVVFEYGSFGTAMTGVQTAGAFGMWSYNIKAYRQVAENNFWYTDLATPEKERKQLTHAGIIQHGFMTEFYRSKITSPHRFGFHLWVQDTRREIPPTMLQAGNESTQQDYALRAAIDWHYSAIRHLTISAKAALIHEGLIYDIGYNQPISNTDMWTALTMSEVVYDFNTHKKRILNNLTLTGGVNVLYSSAVVTGFVPYTTQFRASAFVGVGKVLRVADAWNISLREEVVDGNFIDPVGSAWYFLHLRKWLGIRACVSHNYRVPTFNDLYWVPGGNSDLKEETSWTEELTLELKPQWKSLSVFYALTIYNRNVTNMITWVPFASYWSPQNVSQVWSRGVEHRLRVNYTVQRWHFTVVANADYTRCTYEKTDVANDVSLGRQLIYVPAWFGGATFTAQWTDYFITYGQQYNDLRFTTRDHTEWLRSYSIGSAAIGWSKNKERSRTRYRADLFVRCNNIFDVQYQAVAWRPMPGRSFTVGCTIEFNATHPRN